MYCIECQTRYKTLILQYIRFHTTKTHKHTAQLYRGVSVAAAMGSNKHVKGAESRNVRGGKRRARARTHTPKIGQRYRDTADSREVYRMTVTMFFIYFICLFACLLAFCLKVATCVFLLFICCRRRCCCSYCVEVFWESNERLICRNSELGFIWDLNWIVCVLFFIQVFSFDNKHRTANFSKE